MKIITQVKLREKQKRVDIYLDGEFAFNLDFETFVKSGLKVGDELSEEKIEPILKEKELQKTYEKILKFASLRPRSQKEYFDWLKKHKVHKSLYKYLFDRLKRINLLDDKRFTTWFVNQKIQSRYKSRKELLYELKVKGVAQEIIEDVLSKEKFDEVKVAKDLVDKKMYLWKNLSKPKLRQRVYNFLLRHGFNREVVRNILKRLQNI